MDESAYYAAERGARLMRADRMLRAVEYLLKRRRVSGLEELLERAGVRDSALFVAWAEAEAMEQVARAARLRSTAQENQAQLPLL